MTAVVLDQPSTTDRSARNIAAADPLATFPRRIRGHSGDGRSWGLPADLVTRFVGEAFAHPAVRAQRPILVTLPRGDSAVLQEVEAHVDGALSRVAGVTCLV